jgi:hypothetical protein
LGGEDQDAAAYWCFSGWKDEEKYKSAFERLLKDLKTV